MHYSLVTSTPGEKTASLHLSGSLTIQNARSIQADLLEHAHKKGALHLEVSGVAELDVAFMQILLSLQHYQQQQNQGFSLQLALTPAQNNLLQLAGIETNLSTNFQ